MQRHITIIELRCAAMPRRRHEAKTPYCFRDATCREGLTRPRRLAPYSHAHILFRLKPVTFRASFISLSPAANAFALYLGRLAIAGDAAIDDAHISLYALLVESYIISAYSFTFLGACHCQVRRMPRISLFRRATPRLRARWESAARW